MQNTHLDTASQIEARETPYVAWNAPESISDYLYEWRYRLERAGTITKSGEQDYRPLYAHLKLDSILPYDEFERMALAMQAPSHSVLEHIYHIIATNHNKPFEDVYLKAVQTHLAPGKTLSGHPYRLVSALKGALASNQNTFYQMAEELNIYPSMLQALMEGELVAPPALRDKICKQLKCSDEERAAIQQSGIDYLQSIEATDLRRAFLMRKLAETDRTTPLVQLLQSLMYDGSPITRDELAAHGAESLNTIMADSRDKGREIERRNYDVSVVDSVARNAGLSGNIRSLFVDMGTCRPFGQLLEEYLLAGGRSWSGFIDSVMRDWSLGVVQLSNRLEMDTQIIIGWLGNDHDAVAPSRPNRKSLEKLADNLVLKPVHKEWMMALALGDVSQGVDLLQIMKDAQSHMMTLANFHERERYGARLFDRLLKRGGHSAYYLDDVEGFGPALMKRQRNIGLPGEESTSHPKWNKVVLNVTRRICEAYPPRVAEELALLLQGVPAQKSPAQWLEQVKAGKIAVGEMVKYHRLGLRLPMLEMMERLGKARNTDDYKVCEEAGIDPAACPSLGLTTALANDMGLDEQQTKDFTNLMRGGQFKPSQLLPALDKSLKGEAEFKDVVYHILYDHYRTNASGDALGISALANDLGVSHGDVGHWLYGRRHIRQPDLANKLADIAGIPKDRVEDFVRVAQGKVVQYDPSLIDAFDDIPDSATRYKLFHALRENAKLNIKQCAQSIGVDASSLRKSFLSIGCEWKVTKASVEQMAEVLIPADYPEHRKKFCEWFSAPPTQVQSYAQRLEAERAVAGSGRLVA